MRQKQDAQNYVEFCKQQQQEERDRLLKQKEK